MLSIASSDDASTSSGWSRRSRQKRLTTRTNDDTSYLESKNSQRWALLLLLSMIVFFGIEGIDFTTVSGRRQETHSDTQQLSWTAENEKHFFGESRKQKSIFRRPKGTLVSESVLDVARLEDLPDEDDIRNEFDSISPIQIVPRTNQVDKDTQLISMDALEVVATKDQQRDVLSALQSLLPPPETQLPLDHHWYNYQSFFQKPTSLAISSPGKYTIPTFWHIPKTGGSTIKAILGNCHYQRMASEVGILDGHDTDDVIDVVHIPGQIDFTRHVNVDVTTVSGLHRAQALGLVPSGYVDVIATPLLWDAANLFQSTNRQGKVFSLFRDPISRAVSMFAYLQGATHERTYQAHFANWRLEDYATSTLVEDNFMTRQLLHSRPNTVLDKEDLAKAKAILCQKVFVGLLDRLEESLERFERFFGWTYMANPTHQETCRNSLLANGVNTNTSPQNSLPSKDTVAYKALAERNRFDLELYKFVETLYHHQTTYVQRIPVDIRFINSTCSMCHD